VIFSKLSTAGVISDQIFVESCSPDHAKGSIFFFIATCHPSLFTQRTELMEFGVIFSAAKLFAEFTLDFETK